MNEDNYQDWTMSLGNPQRTNCLISRNIGVGGLVIILDDIVDGEYMSGERRILLRAYDYRGNQKWNFEKKVDWDATYLRRIHDGNLLLIDEDGFDDTVEVDLGTGKKIRSVDLHPFYVYKNIAVETKFNGLKLRKYPSGEHIFEKIFPEEYDLPHTGYRGLLGIFNDKAVADYGDKILILDVKNPGNLIVKDKEMGKGELFKLVNMDENGIVGSYYSEGAPSSMDDQKLGGKKPGVFSSLVYLDYKGQFKWDPVEFGMHVYPEKMPMLNGRVYLDIGQREMYHGDVTSLYCFDLENKTDLWKRSSGRGAIPTEDLVYSNGGKIAVNEYGETVWDIESLGRLRRLLDLSVTRDHVVRHIEDSEARDKEYFIEVIDRYNGTEIAKWKIPNPYRGELYSQLMMCVDYS